MVKIRIIIILILFSIVGKGQDPTFISGFIDYLPSYKGDLVEFIQDNIIYPDSAKICKIEGRVFVEFDIDTLGNTQNHRIKYGIRDDFNNEAIRVATLLKFNPITKKGRKVAFQNHIICVNFKLPKEGRKKNR